MATHKHERQINLYIALLYTNTYLPADKIRQTVHGYEDCASDDSFKRMFERDKSDLRDMGIPIEVQKWQWEDSEGYKIRRGQAELSPITLTTEESAAVSVAAQLWGSRELSTAVQGAVLKLRAAGVEVREDIPTIVAPLPPRNSGSETVLSALKGALVAAQTVQFSHRQAGRSTMMTRTVDPWGLVSQGGRWYLVGHDHDRDNVRTFRVSRIGDDVKAIGKKGVVKGPEGRDVREIARTAVMGEAIGTARVWVAEGRGRDVRHLGPVAETREIGGRAGDVIEVPLRGSDWLIRVVAGLGPDAVVLEPTSLRDDVVARHQRVARGGAA